MEERFKKFNHPKVAELISQIENLKLDQQDLYKTNVSLCDRSRILIYLGVKCTTNRSINGHEQSR